MLAAEPVGDFNGLPAARFGEVDISATRMLAGTAPFGFAVANQVDFRLFFHRPLYFRIEG